MKIYSHILVYFSKLHCCEKLSLQQITNRDAEMCYPCDLRSIRHLCVPTPPSPPHSSRMEHAQPCESISGTPPTYNKLEIRKNIAPRTPNTYLFLTWDLCCHMFCTHKAIHHDPEVSGSCVRIEASLRKLCDIASTTCRDFFSKEKEQFALTATWISWERGKSNINTDHRSKIKKNLFSKYKKRIPKNGRYFRKWLFSRWCSFSPKSCFELQLHERLVSYLISESPIIPSFA